VVAAALQAQMMGKIRLTPNGPATNTNASAAGALAAAKRRAKAAASGGSGSSSSTNGPSLTLAQQLGLVPAPAPKLTGEQWSEVRARARERGQTEHDEPCPICQEEFKGSEQVLLSCSHVFHRACLASFEKFAGKARVCPICRAQAYEKKLIDDSRVAWRSKCALRIQSVWRGYKARRAYLRLLETIPPKDAAKRRAFFMKRLERTSDAMDRLVRARDAGIDALFADLDRSVARVRDSLQAAEVQLRAFSEEEWADIRKRALRRADEECPICMAPIDLPRLEEADDEEADANGAGASRPSGASGADDPKKRPVLLSCSHVLHHGCLLSFERFALASHGLEHDSGEDAAEGGNPYATLTQQQQALEALTADGQAGAVPLFQPPPVCLCPLCRSNYQKRWLE